MGLASPAERGQARCGPFEAAGLYNNHVRSRLSARSGLFAYIYFWRCPNVIALPAAIL
jgi:hypothetical protein